MILHYLALDTLCAVVAWTLLAGEVCGGGSSPQYLIWTGAGIWLVYIADRWLDSLPNSVETSPGRRHRFVGRHRRAVGSAWLSVWCLALLSGMLLLDGKSLLVCAGLVGAAVLYLAYAQQHPPQHRHRSPRTQGGWVVGVAVASAVMLFPATHGEAPPSTKIAAWILVFWTFALQTRATRTWEEGQRIPAGLLVLLTLPTLAWGILRPAFLPLGIAATILAAGITFVERMKARDRISLADWNLALAGLVGFFLTL